MTALATVGQALLAAEKTIEVGVHDTVKVGGFTFNIDTIWATVLAGLIVFGIGLYMARRASQGVPSKLQLAFETITDAVQRQVESSMGPVAPFVVPLAVTLFCFILIANWLELIPAGEHLKPPTADVNLTFALAFLVIIWMHVRAIRHKGLRPYVRHYTTPYKALLPLNLLEELVKPFTLALRLFGNILSGGIMIALIGLFPTWLLWLPNAGWKLIDFAIGVIQAFIFALLTILYFGFAVGEGH
jgi:F-type H+-transporting ATPase subunit a